MRLNTRAGSAITAAALAAVLGACSSSPDQTASEPAPAGSSSEAPEPEAPANLFDFSSATFGPTAEINVQVPKDLLEANGYDEGDLTFTSVRMTGHPLNSADYCAADLNITYGVGVIGRPVDPDSMILDEDIYTLVGDEPREGEPPSAINSADATALALLLDRGSRQSYKDDGSIKEFVFAQSISALDAADPEPGDYFSDDLATITVVTDCAQSPVDVPDSSRNRIYLYAGDADPIASFSFNSMRDGSVSILEAEASGYVRDSNGYWVAD